MRAANPESIWDIGGIGSCVKAEVAEATAAAAAEEEEEEEEEAVEAKGEDVSGSRERLEAMLGRLAAGRDSAGDGKWAVVAAATGMDIAAGSRSGGARALGWEKAIPESEKGIQRKISLISFKRKGRKMRAPCLVLLWKRGGVKLPLARDAQKPHVRVIFEGSGPGFSKPWHCGQDDT